MLRSMSQALGALLRPHTPAGLPAAHTQHRRVRLGAQEVAYEFKRGQRRSIGLSIGPDGLRVRAPSWTPLAEVEALLQAKSAWVLEKLQRAREHAAARAAARTVWADDAALLFLGQHVRLRLEPAQRFSPPRLQAALAAAQPATLCLGLAGCASALQIRHTTQAWLRQQAQSVFNDRLAYFAPLLQVHPRRLQLSNARTRWGSASADGSIRLNWRLIHLELPLIDYVVVHELCHLRHMNHSAPFWSLVASVLPDHAQRRQALRRAVLPPLDADV
ncbi:SprT family zinc-dependent metalloprotease [Hydrogenophaga sp.]|uniref:M48 family metallopeptidase n=1 Tax=Hydrogenophaga sp. TaxID=1904254 RepID=UPI0019B839A1|nr:SprT family zinc-dependent metalloprotease [Hydrogenophaga sp.]MBD3893513.1 M48 family peptidase [Hydrogenophaga sp.]